MALALSLALLAVVLAVAVVRPLGVSEAIVAVPAAVLLVATGVVSWPHARDELSRLGPVVGFLAAVLVLAAGCDRDGLFEAIGARLAMRARSPATLLGGVFAVASVTTAVLSLDTTVVLLTPVVAATAARARVPARAHLLGTAHLANTASLLMPVSNLTNLLAVAVVSISFTHFTLLMAGPWLVAVVTEWAVFRWWRRGDLVVPGDAPVVAAPPLPRFAVAVVTLTLAGFVVTSLVGVAPVWSATAGAFAISLRQLLARRMRLVEVVRSAAPGFLLFVLALAVVVRGAGDHGLATQVRHLMPAGASLPALLGVAALSALLANLINNLPAALLLTPVLVPDGAGPVLAMLLGVNIGPNLTYAGSLATLLWRRVVHAHPERPSLREFTLVGLATVPAALCLATVALWAGLAAFGAT